jgi:hypothetical protein
LKGLKRENLRDHMDDFELIFNMLGERATTEIHRTEDSQGVAKLQEDAQAGGAIAGGARQKLEEQSSRRRSWWGCALSQSLSVFCCYSHNKTSELSLRMFWELRLRLSLGFIVYS